MRNKRPAGMWRAAWTVMMLLSVLWALSGCEDSSVEPQAVDSPSITETLIDSTGVPEFWVLGSEEYRTVLVALELPEAIRVAVRNGDLSAPGVYLYVYDPSDQILTEGMLWDDGGAVEHDEMQDYMASRSGDLVPGDFLFQARLNTGFTDVEGEHSFGIAINGLQEPGTATPDVLPQPLVFVDVTVSANEPPVIDMFQIPDSLHAGFDTEEWEIRVSDPNEPSGDEVVDVMVELVANEITYREFLFAPTDLPDWTFTTDSTFSAGLPTAVYTMNITASDKFDQVSDPVEHEVWIENLAPELLELSAPDTVQQPPPDNPPNVYQFTLEVMDSQGQGDIDEVYYTVVDPTGNFFESPDFVFRDDGEDVDPVAGDGRWNHGFRVDPDVSNFGTYTFTFYARDRAGQVSEPIAKEIDLIVSGEVQE